MAKIAKREKELWDYVNDESLHPLIHDFLFIENQLKKLKKLPFIETTQNGTKETSTSRAYARLLAQYLAIEKTLMKAHQISMLQQENNENNEEEEDFESPLKRWLIKNV